MEQPVKGDQSDRGAEVERAFRALLEKSGLVLEQVDVTSASRVALEFFRDVRFEWISADEESDTYNASIRLEYEASSPTNPLLTLFSKPKPGPLVAIALDFDRVLMTDDDLILLSLDLEFDPDGLESLEELDVTSDGFDSFEDFARAVLTHPSLRRLTEFRPRYVGLSVI